jgi:hypothetical protein
MLTPDDVTRTLDREAATSLIVLISEMIARSERYAAMHLAKNDEQPAAHADLRACRATRAENLMEFATELRGCFESRGLRLPPITGAAA